MVKKYSLKELLKIPLRVFASLKERYDSLGKFDTNLQL